MSKGENNAKQIRNKYSLELLNYDLLEDLSFSIGAFVDYKKIWGAQGRISIASNSKRGVIIINSDITYLPKRKFILAHELGHYIMHKNDRIFICDEEDFVDWNRKNRKETEANEFSAELLMPRDYLLDATSGMPLDISLIYKLKDEFGTSITATLFQFVKHGQVPCCIVFSQNGLIDWFVDSDDFNVGFLRRKVQVPLKTLASDFFIKRQKVSEKEVILASTWFEGKVKQDLYLYEQCHYIDSINAVVSLIWVCEDY